MSRTVSRVWLRRGALGGVGLVIAAYGSVLYEVADIVGEAVPLLALVAGSLLGATLMARLLSPRVALAVTLGLLVAGLVAYLGAVPAEARAAITPGKLLADTVALLTGLSVLRLLAAATWALTVAPGPTFLSWYLGVRGRYAGAVAVAGGMLGVFILTGDAGEIVTLVGAVGGALAVGLGNVERATAGTGGMGGESQGTQSDDSVVLGEGALAQLESLTAVVAAMVLLSATVGLAAGGGGGVSGGGIGLGGSGGGVEANLVSGSDEIEVAGSLSLSPTVRLIVESTERSYWRTATYDRYTGDGWVRTREAVPYEGRLSGPPGETQTIRQRVTARTELGVMPASNAPVAVQGGIANRTLVTPQGALKPADAIAANETYTVVSERPVATAQRLRSAGENYPESLDGTYRELPSSTPERLYRRSDDIAGDETTAYDKAVAIERYLESNKEYSLTVEEPSGDVADTFLFEMDAGYCTYFATTMVALLRAQDVPARLATGYTPGQAVGQSGDETAYVVRGMNAHVWAEVYFPEVGWVRFDPTPGGPRQAAEAEALREARSGDLSDIEALNSEEGGPTPTPTPTGNVTTTTPGGEATADLPNQTVAPSERVGGGPIPGVPSERVLGLWLVALVGAAAVVRRSGLGRRIRRLGGRYYQRPSGDPAVDAQRAWRRVENALEERYRPRKPGETPRAYLDALAAHEQVALDPRVRELLDIHERARYGDGVREVEGTGARQRADAVTRATLPVIGRYYRQ